MNSGANQTNARTTAVIIITALVIIISRAMPTTALMRAEVADWRKYGEKRGQLAE